MGLHPLIKVNLTRVVNVSNGDRQPRLGDRVKWKYQELLHSEPEYNKMNQNDILIQLAQKEFLLYFSK